MVKSFSRTAHSWYRLYSWPCVCAVSRATLWPATCCTISCVPQRSLTPQTTAVCPAASTNPCKSTCPLRYCECVWYMWGHLTGGENRALYSIIVDPMSSHYLPSCSLNRTGGRPGGPLEPGDPVARAQRRGDGFRFYVLDLLLQPELQRLQKYALGEQEMSRSGVKSALCNNGKDKKTSFCIDLKILNIFLNCFC